jgi:hypothetical protein
MVVFLLCSLLTAGRYVQLDVVLCRHEYCSYSAGLLVDSHNLTDKRTFIFLVFRGWCERNASRARVSIWFSLFDLKFIYVFVIELVRSEHSCRQERSMKKYRRNTFSALTWLHHFIGM